ncbi:MAG: NYN domain-containing protein, partial [Candidatus Limnocylindrales bacterium]
MSKNVAVFVDVANIFYAAKAAGVDIDYVTLLKSATANRDFVRAYAYTGLDPENENQRQFHAFLARSGYKVVSKDIRKYGDGRVKANLDIELVVDMMRLAEKLDIAIVVSGDGDFAPAITAVQQKGVRVEVISFRGNTSSDLIDAADVFIDITSVAKVEKGARSGRRVASDGDLSMTAVPDKESGVKPRRRRRAESDEKSEPAERSGRPRRRGGRRSDAEKPAAKTEEVEVTGGVPLVAMPGEKLSRGAEAAEAPAEPTEAEATTAADDEGQPAEGSGRRRRRRRGGRGRGRGGRTGEGETPSGEEAPASEEAEAMAAADYADEVPTLPQHSGFGSVWDSQIGVPSDTAAAASSEAAVDGDELEDEPEVAEYLLTEKKQGRRRGGRGGRGHSSGGYRSALDRERYGVGSGSSRLGRGRGRPSGAPRASAQSMDPIEQTPAGDPWSEVPPEVQELLKAELARREAKAPADEPTAEAAEEKPTKRPTRRRTTKKATEAEALADEATAEAAEEKPTKRPAR